MNSPNPMNFVPPTRSTQRLQVTANAVKEAERGIAVRLEVNGETPQNSIMLSIDEARALSLAIIEAVNKHERHAHTQFNLAASAIALYPSTR